MKPKTTDGRRTDANADRALGVLAVLLVLACCKNTGGTARFPETKSPVPLRLWGERPQLSAGRIRARVPVRTRDRHLLQGKLTMTKREAEGIAVG